MYSELLGRVFVPSMSNSEVFLINGDQEGVEFDIMKQPQMPEFEGDHQSQAVTAAAAASHDHESTRLQSSPVDVDDDDDDHREKKKKKKENTQVGSEFHPRDKRRLELGELNATSRLDHDVDDEDDDDEGFKTPTSLEHRIPEIKQCPPAPRKPMPLPSKKRKPPLLSSPNVRRTLQLDLSKEIESLFPRPILEGLHRKIKKARGTTEEDTEQNQRL